jgi:ribonucleoside-diphosphate reductase beta chain
VGGNRIYKNYYLKYSLERELSKFNFSPTDTTTENMITEYNDSTLENTIIVAEKIAREWLLSAPVDPTLKVHTEEDAYFKKLYQDQKVSFWTPEEIDLTEDRQQFKQLNSDEQKLVLEVLRFFAPSDLGVMANVSENFSREIQRPWARAFMGLQAGVEAIHSETYDMILRDLLGDNDTRYDHLLDPVNYPEGTRQKLEWVALYSDSKKYHFGVRNMAFNIVEGLFFSASFCIIFWLKKRGLLPGLAYSNDLISKDEGLYLLYGAYCSKILTELRLTETEAHAMMKEALVIEYQYVEDILPVPLLGMNQNLMKQYVDFVADYILVLCKYSKLTGASNPFDFMTLISLDSKTNFFEKRSDYSKVSTPKTDQLAPVFESFKNFSGELEF